MKSIKPIKSEKDYEMVLEEIDRLIEAEPGSPESDQLEILSILLHDYEERNYPIYTSDISSVEVIKFWMEQNGKTRKDLEAYLGNRAKVSEILNGRRPLSMLMVRRLVGAGIPAELLISPIPLDKAA
ncbi:MAG: transcriptional regulator [Candidatus Riflebacteria bacterium]|nr:transcriptional regulator [Candidatus Riflebacteria bacterium]